MMLRNLFKTPAQPVPMGLGKRLLIALGFTVWTVAAFLLAQVVVSLPILYADQLGLAVDGINEALLNTIIAGVMYMLTCILAIGLPVLVLRQRTTREELGVQEPLAWRDLLLSPVAYVVYFVCTAILITVVSVLFTNFDVTQKQDVLFQGLAGQHEYLLAFLTLVIIAPIAEELLLRGYLFGKLLKYIPVWIAVLVVSVIFGVLHWQWNVAVDTFALSIVLCALRLYTGTIWAGVVVHMIKNGLAYYLLFVNPVPITAFFGG